MLTAATDGHLERAEENEQEIRQQLDLVQQVCSSGCHAHLFPLMSLAGYVRELCVALYQTDYFLAPSTASTGI